ncbi:hypothetical protein V6N13_085107 [Hibiscus sabdariffa]|uniref:BAG domain-containing protein n=1 Tax=Hibiscus sabdariffa TaxID=183260 RepID=A0ABR2D1G8_9ROSI
MEFPFFQNPWDASSHPRYGRSFRGIPVQVMPEPSPSHSLKPKTVSIPVRFVGSERGRSESAVKIQKVFRGFLVRRNVKKIMAIRKQVNEMDLSVSKTETVDLIRNDSKERLKVNEILMSLLFKLDSVRGVDSCVRDLRKSVIKRAIALQEMVDNAIINSGEQSVNSSNAEVVDKGQDMVDSSDDCNQTLEETSNDAESVPNLNEQEGTEDVTDEGNEEKTPETSENESQTAQENAVEEEEPGKEKEGRGMNRISKEESGRKEMVERIMEDNEKMMRLMEALTARNEMQSGMLRALAQRVEQLEKAFLCDKLRRKKRRSDEKSQCGGKR